MKRLIDYDDERVSTGRFFAFTFYLVFFIVLIWLIVGTCKKGYIPLTDHFNPIQTVEPSMYFKGKYVLRTYYKGDVNMYRGTFEQVKKNKCAEYNRAIEAHNRAYLLQLNSCNPK